MEREVFEWKSWKVSHFHSHSIWECGCFSFSFFCVNAFCLILPIRFPLRLSIKDEKLPCWSCWSYVRWHSRSKNGKTLSFENILSDERGRESMEGMICHSPRSVSFCQKDELLTPLRRSVWPNALSLTKRYHEENNRYLFLVAFAWKVNVTMYTWPASLDDRMMRWEWEQVDILWTKITRDRLLLAWRPKLTWT